MAIHGEPYQAAKFRFHPNYRPVLERLRSIADDYDYIVSSQWPAMLTLAAAEVPVDLHIAHNVDWVLSEQHDPRILRMTRNASKLKRLERQLLGMPETVVTLSAIDAARLRNTGVFALPVRLVEPSTAVLETNHRAVGMLGKMSWPPNHEAALRMRDQILPAVNDRLQAPVTLKLAGHGSESLSGVPNVSALGVVDDVESFYGGVDVVVLPRVDEQTSGISIKLVEAVEAGKQVIAPASLFTACGLTSPWPDGLDDARAIVRALEALYNDEFPISVDAPALIDSNEWVSAGSLVSLMASKTGIRDRVAVAPVEDKLVASMDNLKDLVFDSRPIRIQTLNLHHLYLASHLDDFRRAVLEADFVTADGWPVQRLLKRDSKIIAPRVTGSDFLAELVSDGRLAGRRVALIGGSEPAADLFRSRLEAAGAELALGWHGPRAMWIPSAIARRLKEADIEIVVLAVTPPFGELMAAELRRAGVGASIIAIGGGLDMLVGLRRRAPMVVQRIRLEWAYRMVQDPHALFRRYVLECIPELLRRAVRRRRSLV
jgi:N-acetylglucosaminyldiphosphoundecaprenol N-acetyl-beta-D-mannosaminyltransferase